MRTRLISYLTVLSIAIAAYVVLPGSVRAQEVISKEVKEKIKEVEKIHKDVKYKEFCSNNNWNSDKVSTSELREVTVAANGRLEVDGARNGGISVRGENRSDVLVRACVQAWGSSEQEAKSLASSVRVNTGSVIKADGPSEENGWSVSYEIRAPRNSNLLLRAKNGGISVKSIDGDIDVNTVNGGVSIADASGTVRGKTTNGGLNVQLVGTGWKGSGLDLETTNGGVNLSLPSNFAANVEAGTVNGGFSSDFPDLQPGKRADHQYGPQPKKVAASINGGGAPVRVVTMNGGIRISSNDSKY